MITPTLHRVDSLFLESDLTVKKIEVKVFDGKNIEGLEHPTASFVSAGFCIILMHTDGGLIGIGEPSPYGGDIKSTINAINEISSELKGAPIYDAWAYENSDEDLSVIDYGLLAKQAIIAALSQCCIDVMGKQLKLPAYKILNPTAEGRIPAYASGGMIYDHQSLDLYVEEAVNYANKGFSAWKFRPSTPRGLDHFQRNKIPPPIDIEDVKRTIASVRDSVGPDFGILLDLGCRCKDLDEAIELAEFSLEYNVSFLEEPLPRDLGLYTELIAKTETKISTGETFFSSKQFETWSKNKSIDILQPDMNLVGFREGMKTISVAEEYNKKIVPHNWANSISNLANIHFGVSIGEKCNYVESSVVYNPFRESLLTKHEYPIDGGFQLDPLAYGLGICLA